MELERRGRARAGALAGVLAAHAALVAVVVAQPPRPAPPEAEAMLLLAVEAPKTAAPPAPPRPPPEVAAGPRPEQAAPSPATVAIPCAPIERIGAAIAADPMAEAAVDAAPSAARSVDGAIAVWSDGWLPVAAAPTAPLGPVRLAVRAALSRLPPACLAQPVTGPRLVFVGQPSGRTALAFGSGVWRWSALLEQPARAEFFAVAEAAGGAPAYPTPEGPPVPTGARGGPGAPFDPGALEEEEPS
jgi:hypothetical protein